jgi:hypothetical protein
MISQQPLKPEENINMDRIHSTSLSLGLTNRPFTLECYITIGQNDVPETNNLAYWAHFVTYEENGVL